MSEQLTKSQIGTITGVSAFTSVLSLVGSIFIIGCYLKLKSLRKLSFSLVFLLSCTDVFNQVFDLISPSDADLEAMELNPDLVTSTCLAQAIGDNFFELASVLWTTAIAATLYMTVMWRKRIEDTWLTWAKFSAWCFGVPLLLTIIPGAAGAFGAAGSECWIKESKWGWRFGVFYVPLWLCVAFNAFCYIRVLKLLRRTVAMAGPNDPVAASIRGMMSRLSVYPFILACVWLIPSINAFVEASRGGRQVFGLALVAQAIAGTQGLWNSMAYGFSPGVRDALADTPGCRRCCRSCKTLGPRLCCTAGDGGQHFGSGTTGGAAVLGGSDAISPTAGGALGGGAAAGGGAGGGVIAASKDGYPPSGSLLAATDSDSVSTRSIGIGIGIAPEAGGPGPGPAGAGSVPANRPSAAFADVRI